MTDLSFEEWKKEASKISFRNKAFINGKFVDSISGKTFDSINPASGEILTSVAECNEEDVNLAVNAAKKAYSLCGITDISFYQVEILKREKKKITESKTFHISEIKNLNNKLSLLIKNDLKKITSKRKKIKGINFNKPQIMGVLNITPDSFSDGGKYLNKNSARRKIDKLISLNSAYSSSVVGLIDFNTLILILFCFFGLMYG